MGKILALCDIEEDYVRKMTKYLSGAARLPFEIRAFTNAESLSEFAKTHSIEILLISVQAMQESIKHLDIRKIILLADGTPVNLTQMYPAVYKYQSSVSLVREVMQNYMESDLQEPVLSFQGEQGELIGVYSPVGRCMKTGLALALAHQYGQRGKTLYIGLEEFSPLLEILESTAQMDISDCLYYYRERPEECAVRISVMCREWEGFYIIPPARYPGDVRSVEPCEWSGWLLRIARQAGFQTVVVDIGYGVCGIEEILEVCQKIYMPIRSDWMSAAKKEAFDRFLLSCGKEALLESITTINLPFAVPSSKEEYRRFLTHGELSAAAAALIKEAECA